jgi:hypothetical protein
MITSREAGDIALKHGLSLPDAAALSRMADTTEEADTLAKMFSAPPAVPQLTHDDLATMSPAQINAAREAGRCDDLLKGGSE